MYIQNFQQNTHCHNLCHLDNFLHDSILIVQFIRHLIIIILHFKLTIASIQHLTTNGFLYILENIVHNRNQKLKHLSYFLFFFRKQTKLLYFYF